MGKIMRKVFLDDLNKIKTKIDWKANLGKIVKFDYDDIKGEVQIVDYKYPNLHIKYLDKEPFKINVNSFIKCKLGKLLGTHTKEFKINIGTIFKDGNRNLVITDRCYKTNKNGYGLKYYKYTCNKCGWTEGWIVEDKLLRKETGCTCCGYSFKVPVESINSIVAKEETQWMIPYFQGGYDEAKLYTRCTGKKIYPKCPDCGQVKDKSMRICTIYRTHSIGCNCYKQLLKQGF